MADRTSTPLEGTSTGPDPLPLTDLIDRIDGEAGTLSEMASPPTTPAEAPPYGTEQYIRFHLAGHRMAVPLARTVEIGHLPAVTPLPNLPGWVMGVSNVRGEIVSVVDLAGFFGLPPAAGGPARRMLVLVRQDEMKVGLMVDGIAGILTLRDIESAVQSCPYRKGDPEYRLIDYLVGVVAEQDADGSTTLHIIDVRKLLTAPRMNAFGGE
jgi:purine-binding chemotaxis protein CheW